MFAGITFNLIAQWSLRRLSFESETLKRTYQAHGALRCGFASSQLAQLRNPADSLELYRFRVQVKAEQKSSCHLADPPPLAEIASFLVRQRFIQTDCQLQQSIDTSDPY